MKAIVLLALAGLVSCSSEWDSDDFKVKYSFDSDDDDVKVKIDSDDGFKGYKQVLAAAPTYLAAPAPTRYTRIIEAPRAVYRPVVQEVHVPVEFARPAFRTVAAAPVPVHAQPIPAAAPRTVVRHHVVEGPVVTPQVYTNQFIQARPIAHYVQPQPVGAPVFYRAAPQVFSTPVVSAPVHYVRPQTSFVTSYRSRDDSGEN